MTRDRESGTGAEVLPLGPLPDTNLLAREMTWTAPSRAGHAATVAGTLGRPCSGRREGCSMKNLPFITAAIALVIAIVALGVAVN